MCAVLTVGIGHDIIAPQRSDRSPSRIFLPVSSRPIHNVPQKNSRNPALCMVITELDIGGAEKAFVRLAHGLAFSGWSVRVICLRGPGPLGQELQDREIPVEYLNCRGFADVRAPFRLATSLRKQRPDIVLSFLHQANVASRIACRLAGVAVQVSGIRVADRRLFVMLTERLTARWTTHCVAVSEHVATAHRRISGLPNSQISVIRNGVDWELLSQLPPASRRQFGGDDSSFIIISVGRLEPQKDPETLLQAFRILQAQQSVLPRQIQLLFVGEGPLRSLLEHRVRMYELEDVVKFTGWRSDAASLIRMADVLVLASRWEGLPNVILEAQAAGTPVIASAVDGCLDLVDDQLTGRLFEPGNAERLATGLLMQITQPHKAARMAHEARQQIRRQCSWDVCIDSYDQLLQRLLSATDASGQQ